MRAKIPLIIKDNKVIEYMSVYTFKERIKYWINNNYFTGYLRIPTNKDIHINNVWKDITKKSNF